MSRRKGSRTLLMSVLMSSPGPIVVGLGLLVGKSTTQLADFVRRSAELLAIIAAALITFLNTKLATVLTGDLAVLQNLFYAIILILIVIYNNAPALKDFRDRYNLSVLIKKYSKKHADPSHVKDDAQKWDVVPTKIDMNEILSVDMLPPEMKDPMGKGGK